MGARIPFEYQEVEYIQSHAAQYIDTGLSNRAIIAEIDMMFDAFSLECPVVIGNEFKSGYTYYAQYLRIWVNNKEWNTAAGYHSTCNTGVRYKIDTILRSGLTKVSINGTQIVNSTTGYTNDTGIYIFARRNNYTPYVSDDSFVEGKLYSVKMYSDDNKTELIRDYVPCYRKSDGAGGLYCLITETFFPNQGTGNFTFGADVNYVDRTFQDGTVGSTNVIEGRYINLSTSSVLYDRGNECESVTGGWEANSTTYGKTTKENDYLYMAWAGGTAYGDIYNGENNLIDFTKYTSLKAEVDFSHGHSNAHFGLSVVTTKNQKSSTLATIQEIRTTGTQTVELDISNVNQSAYISFNMYAGYLKIYKVWLE